MLLRPLLFAPIILALAGCGNGGTNSPQKPQISLDSLAMDFNQQFGSGTYIGAKPQNSVQIRNQGLNPLTLTSVRLAGDSAFTMQAPPDGTSIPWQHEAFVTVTFAPTAAKAYNGQITILSNADNTPTVTVTLSGRGVVAPADAGP
jgi:hypothetical protein